MIDKVFNLLKSIDNQASLNDVYSLISLRDKIPRSQPGTHLYDLEIDPSFPLINPDDIQLKRAELKPVDVDSHSHSHSHSHAPPIDIKNNLINYCVDLRSTQSPKVLSNSMNK